MLPDDDEVAGNAVAVGTAFVAQVGWDVNMLDDGPFVSRDAISGGDAPIVG